MDVLRETIEFQRTRETTTDFFAKTRNITEATLSF